MNWFKNLEIHKRYSIIIICICLIGISLSILVRLYRGTWVYQYGNLLGIVLFYGGVLWCLFNTVFLISKYRKAVKQNIIWFIVSALPFLYIATMIAIAFLNDYELERNF